MAMHGLPQGVSNPIGPPPEGEPDDRTLQAPGTFALVFVFLAAFVLYYFVNWKLLSDVWRVG